MHKIIAITLLGLTVLSGPAWSQANLRPDPHPRVPPQPGQSLPLEDALFLKEAASASQVRPSWGGSRPRKRRTTRFDRLPSGSRKPMAGWPAT